MGKVERSWELRAPRDDRNNGDWEFIPLYRASRGAEALG